MDRMEWEDRLDAWEDTLDLIATFEGYDAVVAPKPKPKPATAKGVLECRFLKEEDERLACFNGFTEQIPKFTH